MFSYPYLSYYLLYYLSYYHDIVCVPFKVWFPSSMCDFQIFGIFIILIIYTLSLLLFVLAFSQQLLILGLGQLQGSPWNR